MAEQRVTQLPAEVVEEGAQNGRVTQLPAEFGSEGAQNVRMTSICIELLGEYVRGYSYAQFV